MLFLWYNSFNIIRRKKCGLPQKAGNRVKIYSIAYDLSVDILINIRYNFAIFL